MREGAALVTMDMPCARCTHPFSNHFLNGKFYLCSGCEPGNGCRSFKPPEDAPEAAGAPDAVARIIRDDVELYAVTSILYYKYDISIITDVEFDECCQRLYTAKAWQLKEYSWLDEELLSCGSGYVLADIPAKYYRKAEKKL